MVPSKFQGQVYFSTLAASAGSKENKDTKQVLVTLYDIDMVSKIGFVIKTKGFPIY